MGWNGSIDEGSALGTSITFTPDTSSEGGYTVSSFTAPRKGVYRFDLKGSGGSAGTAGGGKGGATVGYLLLEKNQTVYVGAGGTCSAAFVSSSTGPTLAAVTKGNLYFVAGAGGAGGSYSYQYADQTFCTAGGDGGGASGAAGAFSGNGSATQGGGGTQSGGGSAGGGEDNDYAAKAGAYGTGGSKGQDHNTAVGWIAGGRGGDGYYGGGGGGANATSNSTTGASGIFAMGGGGGSGYVKTATLTVAGKTYASTTSQSGGEASGKAGSVAVTYHARALLPVFFDRTQLERLFFNGTEIGSLVYNGVRLFVRRLARRTRGRCPA